MANPKTVEEALKIAPAGAQWGKPGSSDGKTKAVFLRKITYPGSGKTVLKSFTSGDPGPGRELTPAEAASYFRSKGLTYCNMPQYMPTNVGGNPPAKKKTPASTKGAPKKKEEKPKEEELPPQFDESDILLAQTAQSAFDQANFDGYQDWRVRLSLAPGAYYMYAGDNPGIMQPLQATDGVVFPYTPQITVNYAANYNPIDLTHSNYKVFQYTNSSVDQVTITCDFTAQDVFEARYLLAVIHFFKSMTKMFYGQDLDPIRGTPPPLCYMFGMGGYQFAAHPLAITSFNYNLPNDVDYIKTTAPAPAQPTGTGQDGNGEVAAIIQSAEKQISSRRLGSVIGIGGKPPPPRYTTVPKDITTWVPTKIQLTIGCVPIMSRNQVSNYFSLDEYASGRLIKGTTRPGGGMW